MRPLAVAAVLAVLLSLSGCGDTSGGVSASSPPPASDVTSRVQPATKQQLSKIRDGLEEGFTVAPSGYMVKSSSHNNAYYVAANLQGPGVPGTWATWCLNGDPKSDSGMILSADSVAAEFSDWPAGKDTKARAWITDPDCSALRKYAEGR